MHDGRRLAQALALARGSLSSSCSRLQEPRWRSTAVNLKVEQIYLGRDKAILISGAVLQSNGEATNPAFISGVSHTSSYVSVSRSSWGTGWLWTAFVRGYCSTSESRKEGINVSDAEGEPRVKDGDYDDDDDEQPMEDDSKYEVLDEQRIEDSDEDECYDDEGEQEEGSQEPIKKKSLFQQPKPKVADTGPILNDKITARTVRLVMDNGHRVVTREEALYLAKKQQSDLVQVDGRTDPPVCKIFDFNREQYKREQKIKERKKQKGPALKLNELKELRFNAKTERKDLKMKVERAKEFLERGYRVKFVANFKGKVEDEENKREQGKMVDSILSMIEDVAVIEQGPRVESRLAWVILRHAKFGKAKKPPKPAKQTNSTAEVEDVRMEAFS